MAVTSPVTVLEKCQSSTRVLKNKSLSRKLFFAKEIFRGKTNVTCYRGINFSAAILNITEVPKPSQIPSPFRLWKNSSEKQDFWLRL